MFANFTTRFNVLISKVKDFAKKTLNRFFINVSKIVEFLHQEDLNIEL